MPLFVFAQGGWDEKIDEAFQPIATAWENIVFYPFPGTGIPIVVILLVLGALFFTLYF